MLHGYDRRDAEPEKRRRRTGKDVCLAGTRAFTRIEDRKLHRPVCAEEPAEIRGRKHLGMPVLIGERNEALASPSIEATVADEMDDVPGTRPEPRLEAAPGLLFEPLEVDPAGLLQWCDCLVQAVLLVFDAQQRLVICADDETQDVQWAMDSERIEGLHERQIL